MIYWKNPVSLRQAGFKATGLCEDWLFVGQWALSSTRDELLGKIMLKQLRDAFGRRRVGDFAHPGYCDYRQIIAVEEHDDILNFVKVQGLDWESGGEIDDAEYHDMIGPLVEEYWRSLGISDRLRVIVRNDSPPSLLYSEVPDDSVYSELLTEVEGQ